MKKTVLENGVTVITRSMPAKVTALNIRFEGGAGYEAPHQRGAAHLLEHVAITDRKNITAPLEQVGVSLNATSYREDVRYTALCQPSYFDHVLKTILKYTMVNPAFTSRDVARERQAALHEYDEANSESEFRLWRARNDNMFAGMPYSRDVLGTRAEIQKLRHRTLVQFLNEVVCGEKITVIAAGKLDHERVVDIAERELGSLPRVNQKQPLSPNYFSSGELIVYERSRSKDESVHLLVAFNAPAASPQAKAVYTVLGTALAEGLEGILLDQLRHRRNLVYDVDYDHSMRPEGGHVDIGLTTSPSEAERAVASLASVIDRLPQLVTTDAFARANAQFLTQRLAEPDIPEIWVERAADDLAQFGRIRSTAEQMRNISAVTHKNVTEAAAAFRAHAPFVAMLGPIKKMPLKQVFDDRLSRHYRVP